MKLLIIGIDGGDARIINAMDMPFLQDILRKSQHVPVEEDLFARGWSKILSGQPGLQTGAFYQKPQPLPKGCGASQSFGTNDYERVGAIPLWRYFNQQGLRVGFMNVPTTFPAPKVDGFFISGAGGGLGQASMINDACYPQYTRRVLEKHQYILDTRYIPSGIRQRGILLNQLQSMAERRVACYLALTESFDVDIGFLAFMAPKVIQYLAMQELEHMISAPKRSADFTDEQREIISFYKYFDNQLEKLVNKLKPMNIMIVSDHGQSPRKYDIDIGAFLKGCGWQTDRRKDFYTFCRRVAKTVFSRAWQNKITKYRAIRRVAATQSTIDFDLSHAFGIRHVPGIYINDERFNGPVTGRSYRNELVEEIVGTFNADPVAMAHGMHARPYRFVVSASDDVRDLLPDIWIERPDTHLFDFGVGNSGPGLSDLVAANPAYGRPIDYAAVTRDQWTGIKGRYPLLAVLSEASYSPPTVRAGDLTDAYTIATELATK